MHSAVSGTIDFREPDEPACLERLRRLVDVLPADPARVDFALPSGRPAEDIVKIFGSEPRREYDVRDLLPCLLDKGPFDEVKAEFGQTLVCGYGRLGGIAVGIVANQHKRVKLPNGSLQFGGVIYVDAADKAARFIMDCNQGRVPLLFLQDVNGFMVGRDSEQAGIIRAGAKLVNVIANSVVPKLTVILGGLFRRRQLCPVRQGVRSPVHLCLADRQVRCHGRRAGGQHLARHHRERAQAPGT